MPVITEITVTKRGRFALFLDGEFAFSVDDETLAEERLHTGVFLSQEDVRRIEAETSLRYAKKKALSLLSHKDYTVQMMIQRLLVYEVTEEIARAATQRMVELGLINDRDYALRCSRDLVNLKHYSPHRVARELRYRGVPADYIEEALAQFSEQDNAPIIASVVLKKYYRDLDTPKGVSRAVNGLSRLGYSPGEVLRVITNLLEDPDYYEGWGEEEE